MSGKSSIIMLLLFGFMRAFLTETSGAGAAEATSAFVGKTAIAEKDIIYKVQIEKAYGNEGATREVALISLINDSIEHEIAARCNVNITREELDSFKRYVNENTKAPEMLQKVKGIFGDDLASYEQIYLSPKIMNRKLRHFYSIDPTIHKKERALIEMAYGLVISGKGFQQAAEECGLKSSIFDVTDKWENIQPESLRKFSRNSIPGKDPLIPILATLNTGEVYKKIIEDDFVYRIIRLIKRTDQTFSVEAIAADKRPFDEWLRDESAKIGVEIVDSDLRDKIKTKYPNL